MSCFTDLKPWILIGLDNYVQIFLIGISGSYRIVVTRLSYLYLVEIAPSKSSGAGNAATSRAGS